MAQLMQPLPGIGNQATAGRISQLRIIGKTCAELGHPPADPLGKGHSRWGGELLLQKGVKPLLAALQILKTPVRPQPQRAPNGEHPCEKQRQLLAGQSPLSSCVESDGVCQWVRASRSRERRCQ